MLLQHKVNKLRQRLRPQRAFRLRQLNKQHHKLRQLPLQQVMADLKPQMQRLLQNQQIMQPMQMHKVQKALLQLNRRQVQQQQQ